MRVGLAFYKNGYLSCFLLCCTLLLADYFCYRGNVPIDSRIMQNFDAGHSRRCGGWSILPRARLGGRAVLGGVIQSGSGVSESVYNRISAAR